jgi:GntR family transcriptional regulator
MYLGWHASCLCEERAGCCIRLPHCFFSKIPVFQSNACVYTVYMTMHSWFSISLGDPRPLYLQIMEQVKRRVAVGDLTPGAELPSIRELAAGLQVSVITIKRAYLELEREGVIATRQGKGSVVAERPGLQSLVQERELREHLKQSASLGQLMGISKTEMQRRLADAYEQLQKGKS